tara:strand:+ start:32 stop:355 length:324 start_codon:yes stop_codon:yes gene_type:complete
MREIKTNEEFRKMWDKREEAKKVLKEMGFYVDVLWAVEDVQSLYACDDDEAYTILDRALEDNCSNIWDSIEYIAEEKGLRMSDEGDWDKEDAELCKDKCNTSSFGND